MTRRTRAELAKIRRSIGAQIVPAESGGLPYLETKDVKKSHFESERFLNVAPKMVAQLFEAAESAQNFCGR